MRINWGANARRGFYLLALFTQIGWAQPSQQPERIQWQFQPKAFWAVIPDASQETRQSLTQYENQLYGHAYEQDTVPRRLDRLEQSLGIVSPVNPGPSGERMTRLSRYFAQWSQHPVNNPDRQLSMITYMERHLLKATYPQWSEKDRLTQLEQRVFGQSFSTESTQQRVQRLYNQLPVSQAGYRIHTNSN